MPTRSITARFWNEVAMTLERARQLLTTQAGFGGGYNRQGTRLILAEVSREYGQAAVDDLIHRSTDPVPTTTVSAASGSVAYANAVPGAANRQSYTTSAPQMLLLRLPG